MNRLFLALDIPDAIKEVLVTFQPKPGAGRLHPVSREGLHLTLCFIGGADIEQVHQAIRPLRTRGFSLQLKGLGRYRHAKGGGVLWAGVKPCEGLLALQRRLSAALLQADIPTDTRLFRPHITLARYRAGVAKSRIERFLQQSDWLELGPMRILEFALFSSDTRPEGAVYQIEHTYPLIGYDKNQLL